ncbi:hypothetical protein POM88_017532 [Heracleum sosnowskyi]|uniref:Cytochrome P450 n=1 Tax=Heracleum sosnowskyi TaxID=360622 RepID=A0AAD8IQN2_9APIA|nr:hypothetical protein POM88_017532 [Heracleum sosnowskyi]
MQALQNVYIPGFRFLPTKMINLRWRLEKETRDSVRTIIEINSNTTGNSKNLISLLTSGSSIMKELGPGLEIEEVIDECKTFYFAGKETTANAVTWAVLLLARHPEWQSKARKEVFQPCKDNELPTAEKLHEFKIVTMILKETLGLYNPVSRLLRRTFKSVKVGSLNIPAGTEFYVALADVHHETEIWGPDANEFNPSSFPLWFHHHILTAHPCIIHISSSNGLSVVHGARPEHFNPSSASALL